MGATVGAWGLGGPWAAAAPPRLWSSRRPRILTLPDRWAGFESPFPCSLLAAWWGAGHFTPPCLSVPRNKLGAGGVRFTTRQVLTRRLTYGKPWWLLLLSSLSPLGLIASCRPPQMAPGPRRGRCSGHVPHPGALPWAASPRAHKPRLGPRAPGPGSSVSPQPSLHP